jgi:hypothetical protein
MPTPIAHALGGITAGCLVRITAVLIASVRPSRRPLDAPIPRAARRRAVTSLALLGMLPDVDLLAGMHRSVTHSLGATLVAAAIGYVSARENRVLTAAMVAAAYGSHVLLDWLGTDPGTPHGIMAWWPWTQEFYHSDANLFMRVCREYWLTACWRNNIVALGRELVVLVPVTLAAVIGVRRALHPRRDAAQACGDPRRTD